MLRQRSRKKLELGESPRVDGFFEDREDNRSTAAEVFEGVILASQREAQEKKVRLYGNLLANLAFDKRVDREHANFLIKLGEDLSYRQLCLISLFAQNTLVEEGNNRLNLQVGDYRENEENLSSIEVIVLLQEIYDLYQRGIVHNGGEAMISFGDANPSQLSPFGAALYLYDLMELGTVSNNDLVSLIVLLS